MYEEFIKYEYLISPVNGYHSRNLVSNKGTIKKFGFDSIDELESLYPRFPLECQSTIDIKSKISNSRKTKKYLDVSDPIPSNSCFQDGRYKNLYFGIIENAIAKNQNLDGYFEVHHVIPKSFGGADHWSNLVRLTAREHFLCHYLLTKMVKKNSEEYYLMCHAFQLMSCEDSIKAGKRYMNSRLFESARIGFSKRMSILQSGNGNSQYGRSWISNFQLKISKPVKPEELQDYLDKGWHKRKVLNFDIYDSDGIRIPKIKDTRSKLEKYREDKGLNPPSNLILSKKHIREMYDTLSQVNFDFNVEDLDTEYYRIQKMLSDDIWVKNLSFVQVSQKYNSNYMTLQYISEAFDVKRRTLK